MFIQDVLQNKLRPLFDITSFSLLCANYDHPMAFLLFICESVIMQNQVADKKGAKKWKRVEVKLEDHIKVPRFPAGMSPEFYDGCFDDYLSTISLEQIPPNRPLWEVHIIKYATSNAAGNVVFKLHHSLGDGYSLMGALLSCLQRADNPSLPLTLPSIRSNSKQKDGKIRSVFKVVPRVYSKLANTVLDLGFSLMKSNFCCRWPDPNPIR